MADIFDDEKDKLLDHDYDGIKELDNHMPSWWVWGFYVSIIFGAFYLIIFELTNIGMSQEEEYLAEMASAKEKYNLQDEDAGPMYADAVFLTAAEDIAKGKELYFGICHACHGQNAEGLVGPNLTDDMWIYGCDAPALMVAIKKGFPQKAMPAYGGGKALNDEELLQLSSYIFSLRGSNPENAKPADMSREKECDPSATSETTAEAR